MGAIPIVLGMLALAHTARAAAYDAPTLSAVTIQGRTGWFDVLLQVQAGASGTPGGFTVEWMTRADYVRLGGWPLYGGPEVKYCTFVDQPSLVERDGTHTFHLGSGESAVVEPGNLFDETGIATNWTDALTPGTDYVLRAYAESDQYGEDSPYSQDLIVTTSKAECTQGFWKNHPENWPAAATPMTLGTVAYSAAQLQSIFAQSASGNGLVALAHQLIAAKLNLANGSDPTNIASTIAAADALIGNNVVPPVGTDNLPTSSTNSLTDALDDYNNGRISGVANCPTPTHAVTWGTLKTRYR
jgi:hypothetical protein